MDFLSHDKFWDAVSVPRIVWALVYMLPNSVILISGVVYAALVWRDLHQPSPRMPGFKAATIVFIFAVIVRGLGGLAWGILIIVEETSFHPAIDMILNGLPGYIITFSYCFMFFLWCSISINLLMNDASDFYSKLRNWHLVCLMCIGVCACALITARLIVSGYTETLHHVEVWSAVIRDLFTFSFIVVFTARIVAVLRQKTSLLDKKCEEAAMCRMSIGIAICLFVRAASILIYFYAFVYGKGTDPAKKWGVGGLINTMIGQIVCELTPIIIIIRGRKKSALLSVYDPLE